MNFVRDETNYSLRFIIKKCSQSDFCIVEIRLIPLKFVFFVSAVNGTAREEESSSTRMFLVVCMRLWMRQAANTAFAKVMEIN